MTARAKSHTARQFYCTFVVLCAKIILTRPLVYFLDYFLYMSDIFLKLGMYSVKNCFTSKPARMSPGSILFFAKYRLFIDHSSQRF